MNESGDGAAVTRVKETMSKTSTQSPTDPTAPPTEPTVPPTDPTAPPTEPTVPEATPAVKGYAVKVGKESPVHTVRSAGIVFTAEAQFIAVDHPAVSELRNNPWLDVTEVTE